MKTAGRAGARSAGVSGSRFCRGGGEDAPARWESNYFSMLGHSHPFSQSLQQSFLHSQFGHSLQQSFEQHSLLALLQQPSAFVAAVVAVELELLAIPAATIPAATAKPPNNLTNIGNSLSWMCADARGTGYLGIRGVK